MESCCEEEAVNGGVEKGEDERNFYRGQGWGFEQSPGNLFSSCMNFTRGAQQAHTLLA